MDLPEISRRLAALVTEYSQPGPVDEGTSAPPSISKAEVMVIRRSLAAHHESPVPSDRQPSQPLRFWLFGGRWCGDCRQEIPKLVQVLVDVLFDDGPEAVPGPLEFKYFAVPIDKAFPTTSIKMKKVTSLPTLVLMKGEKELGRIVERPRQGWAMDLLEICQEIPHL